jgi:hypothetical protein
METGKTVQNDNKRRCLEVVMDGVEEMDEGDGLAESRRRVGGAALGCLYDEGRFSQD